MIFSTVGIPRTHQNCSFKNFQSKNLDKIKALLIDQTLVQKKKGAILIGPPGVGKTHLLVATFYKAQELKYIPGANIIFFDWQEFLNWLRGGFDLSVRADLLVTKICKQLDFLILDDIRPEPRGSFWKEILELVIEAAYINQTILLSSTNADNATDLLDRWQLTDYHASRLKAMCDIITMRGKDYRLK